MMRSSLKNSKFRWLILAAVPVTTSFLVQTAFAADEPSSSLIETIVVTAQKRPERLQDVPLAISAVSGEALEKAGASRLEDIVVPAVKVGTGGATDSMFIRGIGSGTNSSFEQSAPMFLDGMWFSSSRAARVGLLDLERIEVVKGPQPTYFGKNAIAGAVSVVSAKPKFKQEGFVDAIYEFENQEKILVGAFSAPIGETLALRVAGKVRALDKGWEKNLATGTMDPRYRDNAGRVSLRWMPNDSFTLDAKIEAGENQETGRSTEMTACTPAAAANRGILNPAIANCVIDFNRAVALNPASFGVASTVVNTNRPAEQNTDKVSVAQIAAQWNFNGYNLAANLSSYKNDFSLFGKQDHSSVDRAMSASIEKTDNSSFELRLDSPRNASVFWTAGVYSDRGTTDIANEQVLLLAAANGGPTGIATGAAALRNGNAQKGLAVQDAHSWAAFGEVGFSMTDNLIAKLAVRETTQNKSLTGTYRQWNLSAPATTANVAPGGLGGLTPAIAPTLATLSTDPTQTYAGTQSLKNQSTDPAVSVEWRPINRQLFYASLRKGFKAGGLDFFNTPYGSMEYKPETVNYGELGTKLDLMNGAVRFNAALFRADYKNLQTAIVDPITGLVTTKNAGGARSQGIELEATWAITEQWRLGGSLNFLDSKYTEFKNQSCWGNPIQTVAEGCVGGTQDMSGRETQFAPKWSGAAELRYRRPGQYFGIPSVLTVQMNLTSSASFISFGNADPRTRVGGYNLFDLRFGLAETKNKWDVGFLIRNVFNETTEGWIANLPVSGQYNGGHFAVVNRPRQFALQGKYNF